MIKRYVVVIENNPACPMPWRVKEVVEAYCAADAEVFAARRWNGRVISTELVQQ